MNYNIFIAKYAKKTSKVRNKYSKLGKLSLVILSALLIITVLSSEAQAKGKEYVYTCISTTVMFVCTSRDSIGRCTKIRKRKKCTAWKKTRVSSRVVPPGGLKAKQ